MDSQKAHSSHKAKSSNPSRPETSQSHSRQSSQGRPSYEISKPLPLSPAIPQHPLPSTRYPGYPTDTRTPRVPRSTSNERQQTTHTTTRTPRNPSQMHARSSSEPSQAHTPRTPRAASNERPQGTTPTTAIRSVTPSRVTSSQAPAKRSLDLPRPSTTRVPHTPTNERPQAPFMAPTIRPVIASQSPARVTNERSQVNSSRAARGTSSERPQVPVAPVTIASRRPTHPWQRPVRENEEQLPGPSTAPTPSTKATPSSSTRTPKPTTKAPTAPLPALPLPPSAAPSVSNEHSSSHATAPVGGQIDLEVKRNARQPKERVTLRLLRPLSKFSRKSNLPPEAAGRLSHEKGMEDLPSFMPWRPLPGPKILGPEEEKFRHSMRKRRIRIFTISGIIILLLIITIILLVRLVRPHILSAESTLNSHSSGTLSRAQQTCLDDFRNQASSDPMSYSCSTCLPALRDVPQEYLNAAANANDTSSIHSTVQFCGLRAVFDSSTQNGHSNLTNAGWFRDTNVCSWGGVTCDGSGLISSLQLRSPASPQTIPDDISALTSLSQLEIVGDTSSPIGQVKASLPSSLRNLTLINTSLTGFENDSLFQQNGSLSNLETLTMDGNANMGASLPGPISNLPLKSLVVRNQNLNMDLNPLFSSRSLGDTLTTLDLSHNALTGNVPFIVFSQLMTLDLSFNNFQNLAPEVTFPSNLQTLSFQNNTGLQGNISTALCTSTQLSSCSFQGTGFSSRPNITCGTCRF